MDFVKCWLHPHRATRHRAFLILSAFVSSTLAVAQDGSGRNAEDSAITQLEQFVANVDDLTADFDQRVYDVDDELIDDETSTGTFSLLRPNRFTFHYHPPLEYIVMADGESLMMYDVELETATIAPLQLGASPAMILSGEGTVSEGFDITDVVAEDGSHWLELEPLDDNSEFLSARISFLDGRPAALELVDGTYQTTRIDFSNVVVNSGLRARDFEFDLPSGVDIVGRDEE